MAQGEDETRIGKEPVNQAAVACVKGVFVDEYFFVLLAFIAAVLIEIGCLERFDFFFF